MIITAEQFLEYTGDNSLEPTDDFVSECILTSQQMIENYIGYEIENRDYTDEIIYSSYGLNQIDLKVKPVKSITSIEVDGTIIDLETEEYFIKDNYLIFPNYMIDSREYKIKVSFNAGYETVNIPEIFKLICKRIATRYFNEYGGDVGLTSKSFGDGSRNYDVFDFSNYLKVLKPYIIV